MFSIVIARALHHVIEIEIEDARGKWVDQNVLARILMAVPIMVVFVIALPIVRIGLFLFNKFAHRLDLFFADLGLIQTVCADRGLKRTVKLGGECRVEQLHCYPCVHLSLDALQRHSSIEGSGDGDGGDGGVAGNEVILLDWFKLFG